MAGARPRPGNRSAGSRLGVTISRQLRAAGYKILYAEHQRRYEGVFVSSNTMGGATIVLDYNTYTSFHRELAKEISEFLEENGYEVSTTLEKEFISITVSPR